MADSSFDITSKIDRMELDNAINQAIREIDTRFDFKNTGSSIELKGEVISIEADTEERAKAALDVVKDKMIKRGVSLKHLDAGAPQLSGKIYKIAAPLKEGISQLRMLKRLQSFYVMTVLSHLRLRSKEMNFASQARVAMIYRQPWHL